MKVDFNPVQLAYHGATPIIEIRYKGYKVWPAKRQEFYSQLTNAFAGPAIRYTVEQGAVVRTYGPTEPRDQNTWTDMNLGLFKMDGGKLVPVTDLSIAPQDGHWWVQMGTLDYNPISAPGVVQSNSLSALSGVWETQKMPVGEYHILSGLFSDFDPGQTQFIIDIQTPIIANPILKQLPDDPWTFPQHTITVRRGQTITFLYPRHPKSVNSEPTQMGWRHLNFAYIKGGQTYDAAFPSATGKQQIDVLGRRHDYSSMQFGLYGAATTLDSKAFDIGQWAASKDDITVMIRGDATEEYVYVVCYNGNWANTPGPNQHMYDNSGGVLYKIHITDALTTP